MLHALKLKVTLPLSLTDSPLASLLAQSVILTLDLCVLLMLETERYPRILFQL